MLSVRQSVSVSRLDRTQAAAALDRRYRLFHSGRWRDWSGGGGTPPPPPPPTLLFGQLIDLLTPAARHVSLNLISEFISGWTCAHRNDVEFPPRNRVKDRG